MQLDINLGTEIRRMRAQFQDLTPAKFDQAIASALNKTGAVARTQSTREIRSVYKMSARELKRSISLTKARARAGVLEARVAAVGGTLPSIAFGARQTKKGVTINVKGARRLIPGAFIVTMRSGHTGVFARTDTAGKGYVDGELQGRRERTATKNNTPITEVRTVGVPRAFAQGRVLRVLEARVLDHFPPTLLHELRWRNGDIPTR